MIRIILLCCFVLLPLATAFDVFDVINVSYDELPVSGSINLTLSLQDNETIFLTDLNTSSSITLDFPASVYLNNTNITTIRINYSIPELQLVENTTYNRSVLINNSLNANTVLYGLYFNITGSFTLVDQLSVFDVFIVNNEFVYNITENLLPASGVAKFRLRGRAGERVNITCQSWLSCPESVVFGSNNQTLVDIDWRVPLDAALGTTIRRITFEWSNQSKNDSITFNLLDAPVTVRQWTWDVDRCFDVLNQSIKYECWQEYEDFQIERANQLVKRAMALGRRSCNCTNTTTTQYVVYGNVTEKVARSYDQCISDRDSARTNYNVCTADLDDAQSLATQYFKDLTVCETNLLDNETSYRAECFAEIKRKDAEWTDRNKNIIRWTVGTIVFAVVFIVFVLWQRNYRKKNMVMP